MSSITIITLPNGITVETTNGTALAEALATLTTPAAPVAPTKAPKAKAEAPAQEPTKAPAQEPTKAPKAPKAGKRTPEQNRALHAAIGDLTREGRFDEARAMLPAGWSAAAIDKAEAAGPKAPKSTRAAKREAKAKAEAITETVRTEAVANDAAAQVPAWHSSRIVAASHRGLSGRLKAMLQSAAGDGDALVSYWAELTEAADACDVAAEALTGKAQEALLSKAATVAKYAAMASAMAKALTTGAMLGE